MYWNEQELSSGHEHQEVLVYRQRVGGHVQGWLTGNRAKMAVVTGRRLARVGLGWA
jgi:hypothetical protein